MGQSHHTISAVRWMKVSRRMSAMAAALAAASMLSGCYYMSSDDEEENAAPATPGTVTGSKGDAQTRSYALSGFDAVTLAGPDNIIIRRGDRFSVTATGPKATLDNLVIAVRDKDLEVKRRRGNLFGGGDDDAQITITLPALRAATMAGSGTITSDTLSGDDAAATMAGSGDMTLTGVDAGALDLSVAGSGDMSATGRTRSVSVSIAGSGSVAAAPLSAETADISIAGSGSLEMTVSGTADVSLVGSGDVTLTGGARCTTSKMGSGDVSCS